MSNIYMIVQALSDRSNEEQSLLEFLNKLSSKAGTLTPTTPKSDTQLDFETQAITAIAMVRADAVSALETTGIIRSLSDKIHTSTLTWSSENTFVLVDGLLNFSHAKNRKKIGNDLVDADVFAVQQHVRKLLTTVFDAHNVSAQAPTHDTITGICAVGLLCIMLGYIDLWEFVNANLIQFVQNSKVDNVDQLAINAAYKNLEYSKSLTPADLIIVNRGLHNLVRAGLTLAENLPRTSPSMITSIQRLINMCNEKKYIGLYNVLFTSFTTLVQSERFTDNDGKLYSGASCSVGDWAEHILEHSQGDYFQEELADQAIPFSTTIHKILASYVDWSAPYKVRTTETKKPVDQKDNNTPAIYEESHALNHYLSFIELLLERTTQERTAVALQIERVVDDNSTGPWISQFARKIHQLVSNNLVSRSDYLDSGITHLLTVLNQVM